ncbi:MAG TPA: aspartate/glutamate racemase family protein, partial [Gemmatimonadales bacterium]|nr:aspartate/glutamate racemase family protein [Gemmatimonadales bacterium]
VIEPGARAAVTASKGGALGIIGTVGTISSGAYQRAIAALNPKALVEGIACPLFVPLVEEGWLDHPATELIAREYLAPFIKRSPDAVVLGCTHYPLIKAVLGRVLGAGVTLIDSGGETAKAVQEALEAKTLQAGSSREPSHHFVVSDDAPRFRKIGATFLGDRLRDTEVEVVSL